MPARRDRHGVVVEDETQVTKRDRPNDPSAESPREGSHSETSVAADVRRDDSADSRHYDEPTRLVRRSGRGSPADNETTIVHRPGHSSQPRANSGAQTRRQDGSSQGNPEAPGHYDEPTQVVHRRRGYSAVDDATSTRSQRSPQADRTPQDEVDDPVTGWLVVVAGRGKGRSLTLGAGRNEIGRGTTANVRLDFGDREVSRNAHAYITYDDEARLWYVQQGGGRNLVRLAGRPVLEPTPLQAYAKLRIGRTHLVFVPLCGEGFDWDDVGTHE